MAARPAFGKTAFALNLAAGHSKNGGAVSIFSLEMGTKQLLRRLISAEGSINGGKWRNMSFSKADYENTLRAVAETSEWKLDFYDRLRSLPEIRSAIRKRIRDTPNERHLMVNDYLQLISKGPV